MRRGLTVVAMVALGLAGCGGSKNEMTQGYFDMPTLASAIKNDKTSPNVKGPWGEYPAEVTCAKTGPLEASCTLRYHELNGSGIGQATEKATIATDGKTYEAEEHGEIQAVE